MCKLACKLAWHLLRCTVRVRYPCLPCVAQAHAAARMGCLKLASKNVSQTCLKIVRRTPQLAWDGTGGTYVMRDTRKVTLAAFKHEEPISSYV